MSALRAEAPRLLRLAHPAAVAGGAGGGGEPPAEPVPYVQKIPESPVDRLQAMGLRAVTANCGACFGCRWNQRCRFATVPDLVRAGASLVLPETDRYSNGQLIWKRRRGSIALAPYAWLRGEDTPMQAPLGPIGETDDLPTEPGPESSPAPISFERFKHVADEFWAHVDYESWDCWEWQGLLSPAGYPVMPATRSTHAIAGHRLAVVLHAEMDLPAGWLIRHLCGTKACIRPDHLKPGSAADNADDEYRYGRLTKMFSWEDVLEIRGTEYDDADALALAPMFGVSEETIARICDGTLYGYVDEDWNYEVLSERDEAAIERLYAEEAGRGL